MKANHFTDEMDAWINEHSVEYRRRPHDFVEAFNSTFNTTCTLNSLYRRRYLNGTRALFYSKEQVEWLRERFYVDRDTLTKLFNKRYNDNRTVEAITSKMIDIGAIRNSSTKRNA